MIDELRREDTPISRNIADHIDSFTDYDFAHLLFSDGTVENAISMDRRMERRLAGAVTAGSVAGAVAGSTISNRM